MNSSTSADTGAGPATVMFADISGFTALSERLDPEEVTAIINACFERLESIVFAHGGIVDEYLGDCVKAVFGFSHATATPTRQAVHAALEIRDALYQFNRDHDLASPLDIHIGINSGPAIALFVGSGHSADFSVVGHAARIASHLEDVSDRGKILVGRRTWEETASEFDYQPLPPLRPGPDLPAIEAYELLGARPVRRVQRQSERRHATVLFADVLGFEELSVHLDTTGIAAVLRDILGLFADAVAAHGGVVDKQMGDGIMALFGIPNAIEYAPWQAVNAAVEMRQRFDDFVATRRLPVPLHIQIGVNTGLVIAGTIGGRVKRSFTAMGDTVNLAARLKEAAGPGAVFVGPETHRETHADFDYQPTEPLRLKGKAQPVPAHELLSTAVHVHRVTTAPSDRRVFSALVGRESELAAIRTRLDLLLSGEGGIVSLVGEPGIGKTRLMDEVVGIARDLPITWLRGRSLAIGRNLSFHPFVDLFRQWAAIADDENEALASGKLQAATEAALGGDADEVFPFVARLMGLRLTGAHAARVEGIEGEALEKLVFKSVRTLLHAVALHRPLMMVFEDLHWADLSSVNLLEILLGLTREVPILFLHVLRPQFADTGDRLVQSVRDEYGERHTEIVLAGLDAKGSSLLVRNLLHIDDLPAPLQAVIVQRAEGNPFFIEEVVRSLIDAGAVERSAGGFRVTERIHDVVIPGRIQDVIMARVDRFDEETRQLLQTAAVIGRSFFHRILAALQPSEATRIALSDHLGFLQERQVIFEQRHQRPTDALAETVAAELEYVFQHALVQDTIYNSILQKTRRELHQRVGACIEAAFADRLDEFYGMLAYHYTRADNLEKAEDYLFKAGELSARTAASNEALHFFQEAARIYLLIHGDGGDPRRRAALEKNIGLALLAKGKLGESVDHFDRSLEFLGERLPKTRLAVYSRFGTDLAAVLFKLYAGSRAERRPTDLEREVFDIIFNRARALTTTDPERLFFDTTGGMRRLNRVDPGGVEQSCGMYAGYSLIFAFSGLSFAVSRRLIDAAESLVRADNPRDAFVFRTMRFIHHFLEGNWDERYAIGPNLVEQNLRLGQLWEANTYLGLDCDRRLHRGDFAGARDCLAKLDEMIRVYGYEFAQPNHDGMTALLLLEERRLGEALSAADDYLAQVQEDPLRILAMGTKAKVQILSGDADGAEATLGKAAEVLHHAGRVPPWHLANFAAARVLLDVRPRRDGGQPERPGASRHVRTLVRTAAKVAGARTEAYRLAGSWAWSRGRHAQAMHWWRRSLDTGKLLAARPELARTDLEIARALDEAGGNRGGPNGESAAVHRERATRLCAEIGLDPVTEAVQHDRA